MYILKTGEISSTVLSSFSDGCLLQALTLQENHIETVKDNAQVTALLNIGDPDEDLRNAKTAPEKIAQIALFGDDTRLRG